MGSLDKSLRLAAKKKVERLPVVKSGKTKFVFSDTKKPCSVQEALYYYFGVPIHIIAQPRVWYSYHRTPHIAECASDRAKVLVRFSSTSWSGESFGGTCLYIKHDDEWGAYGIRPNQSDTIASAESWLVKRKWQGWA